MAEISNSNPADVKGKASRPLIEFAPLFLFFGTNYFAGIFWGTSVLIVATIISLGIIWHLDRRIPMVAALGCVAVAFFGGLTLFFEDEFLEKYIQKMDSDGNLTNLGLAPAEVLKDIKLNGATILTDMRNLNSDSW